MAFEITCRLPRRGLPPLPVSSTCWSAYSKYVCIYIYIYIYIYIHTLLVENNHTSFLTSCAFQTLACRGRNADGQAADTRSFLVLSRRMNLPMSQCAGSRARIAFAFRGQYKTPRSQKNGFQTPRYTGAEKNKSFCASLGSAVRRQKLPSSP